jgi:hypothetical protein
MSAARRDMAVVVVTVRESIGSRCSFGPAAVRTRCVAAWPVSRFGTVRDRGDRSGESDALARRGSGVMLWTGDRRMRL